MECQGSRLFQNPFEALVMIVGIVVVSSLAGNDPSRAAVASPGCFDRIFSVVAAWLSREALLVIAEDDAVPGVRKGAAGLDQQQCLLGFTRKLAGADLFNTGSLL